MQKKKKFNDKKENSSELCKLINDINYFKFFKFEIIFDDVFENQKIEYDLKLYKLPPDEQLQKISCKKLNLISDEVANFYDSNYQIFGELEIFNFTHMINIDNSLDVISNSISQKLKNKISNQYLFKNIHFFNFFIKNNIFFEIVKYINCNNQIDLGLFLRFPLDADEFKNNVNKMLNCNINVDVFNIGNDKCNNSHNINFENYDDLIYVTKLCKNKKFDLLYFKTLFKTNSVNKLIIDKKIIFPIELIAKIFLCLNLQKKNGSVILHTVLFNTNAIFEMILILKKYYLTIKVRNDMSNKNKSALYIECSNFLGINPEELSEFEKIIIKISNDVKNFTNYSQSNKLTFEKILNLNSYQKSIVKKFKNISIQYFNEMINNITSYGILLQKIKKYIDNNKLKYNNNILLNTIYKRQISEYIYFLNLILNKDK